MVTNKDVISFYTELLLKQLIFYLFLRNKLNLDTDCIYIYIE
jgi:hypothetical protein